jgi:hypothetical protein
MSGYRKHRPFIALSRRHRRKKVINLKNLIHRERHRCGGLFYDDADITQYDKDSDRVWSWSDIYFPGLDPAVLWNVEIITAHMAFRDAVSDRAFNEGWARLDEQERASESRIETRPVYNAQGKIVAHAWMPSKAREYAALDDLSFAEYVTKREHEITRHDPPAIYCGHQFLPGYAYGIGMRMIVDAPALTLPVINAAILDFRARGEREWRASEPAYIELKRNDGE